MNKAEEERCTCIIHDGQASRFRCPLFASGLPTSHPPYSGALHFGGLNPVFSSSQRIWLVKYLQNQSHPLILQLRSFFPIRIIHIQKAARGGSRISSNAQLIASQSDKAIKLRTQSQTLIPQPCHCPHLTGQHQKRHNLTKNPAINPITDLTRKWPDCNLQKEYSPSQRPGRGAKGLEKYDDL